MVDIHLCGPDKQQPERFPALRRYHRLRAAPLGLFVKALLDFEQSAVSVLGIGHQLAPLVSVDVLFLQQEPNECLFLHAQLLGRFPEVGQQIAVHQFVEVVRLGLHDLLVHRQGGVCGLQLLALVLLLFEGSGKLNDGVGIGNQLFDGVRSHIGSVLAD